MTPLVPPDLLLPIWLGISLIVFVAVWLGVPAMGGSRDFSESWKPALFMAIKWPIYAVTIIPIILLSKLLRWDK